MSDSLSKIQVSDPFNAAADPALPTVAAAIDPETVKAAFVAKNIPVEVEVYPADHGWCPPDSQVFDQAQADRAWDRLLATFKAAL